ncbi:MAG: DUF2934 domain-containing protein [Thiobacillus sp.]
MAKQTRKAVDPQRNPDITWRGGFSLEQREAMIRDAAYYRYQRRGHTPGHDLDDWLAAESELEGIAPGAPEFPSDTEMHQSSTHGARKDDELKRIARQHPQKGIPQIEGIEPENAPFKE